MAGDQKISNFATERLAFLIENKAIRGWDYEGDDEISIYLGEPNTPEDETQSMALDELDTWLHGFTTAWERATQFAVDRMQRVLGL